MERHAELSAMDDAVHDAPCHAYACIGVVTMGAIAPCGGQLGC